MGVSKPIAMADTRIDFNGCRVFMGNLNPNVDSEVAGRAAKKFAGYLASLNERARTANLFDFYTAHFGILGKIKAGEDLLN